MASLKEGTQHESKTFISICQNVPQNPELTWRQPVKYATWKKVTIFSPI